MNASDVNQDLQLMSTSNDFTDVGIDNTIGTTDTNVDANQFDPDPNEQPIQASQLTPLQDQQFTNSDPSPASDFSNRESGTNVLTDTTNSQETASPTQDVNQTQNTETAVNLSPSQTQTERMASHTQTAISPKPKINYPTPIAKSPPPTTNYNSVQSQNNSNLPSPLVIGGVSVATFFLFIVFILYIRYEKKKIKDEEEFHYHDNRNHPDSNIRAVPYFDANNVRNLMESSSDIYNSDAGKSLHDNHNDITDTMASKESTFYISDIHSNSNVQSSVATSPEASYYHKNVINTIISDESSSLYIADTIIGDTVNDTFLTRGSVGSSLGSDYSEYSDSLFNSDIGNSVSLRRSKASLYRQSQQNSTHGSISAYTNFSMNSLDFSDSSLNAMHDEDKTQIA